MALYPLFIAPCQLYNTPMTSLNHSNNLCLVTLHYPSSTPPPSSTASPSSASSTGWTLKITKKIQELKSKLENLNKLKNAKNNYLPEKDSKSLDSLPTQVASLETVQKLAEFAESLTKEPKNNNILTHLCDGLQTFLGFDSASKGYNGTGIVYSDLDRLCDGVMGFLHGVLEAVKNENEVETYDKHLEKNLKSVLDLLNNKIGTGRTGLAVSVGAVKEWLEGYGKKLKEKTAAVNKLLKTLSENIDAHKITVDSKNNLSLNDQLTNWTSVVDALESNVIRVEEDYVSQLDEALQKQISGELKPVKLSVEMLKNTAADRSFQGDVRKMDDALLSEKLRVKNAIDLEAMNLQETLNTEYKKIIEQMKAMTKKRNEQIRRLKDTIVMAKNNVENEFGDGSNSFKSKTIQYFYDIKQALKNVNKEQYAGGDGEHSLLQNDVAAMKSKLLVVGKTLNGYVTDLERKIADAETLRNSAQTKAQGASDRLREYNKDKTTRTTLAENVGNIVEANTTITKVNDALQKIDGSLNSWIFKAAGSLQVALQNVNSILRQVETNSAESIRRTVEGLKHKAQEHFVKLKKQELEGCALKAREHMAMLANRVESLVDEKLKDAQDKYEMWVNETTNVLKQRNAQSAIEALITLSNAIRQGATDVLRQNNGGQPATYSVLSHVHIRSLYQASTELQQLRVKCDGIERQVRMNRGTQGSPDGRKVADDFNALSDFALLTKKTVNAAITLLNERIDSEARNFSGALATVNPLNGLETMSMQESLRKASQFAQLLHNHLRSQFRQGDFDIGNTHGELISLMQSVTTISSDFTSGINLTNEFENKVSQPFTTLLETVKQAANNQNGLHKVLTDMRDTQINGDSAGQLNGIYTDLSKQSKALSDKPGKIDQAIIQIRGEIGRLGIALNSLVMKDDLMNTLMTLKKRIGNKTKEVGSLGQTHDELQKLYTEEFAEQNSDSPTSEMQKAIAHVVTLIVEVEKAPEQVDEKRHEIDRLMDTLRGDIIGRVNYITVIVKDVDDILRAVMGDVYAAVRSAKETLEESILTMKRNLVNALGDAFNELNKQVKELFADGHMAQLKSVGNMVYRQSKTIEDLIKKNMLVGIKGLLRTMKYNGSLLEEIQRFATSSPKPTREQFANSSDRLQKYMEPTLNYIYNQVTVPTKPLPNPPTTDPANQLTKIKEHFDKLLGHLKSNTERNRIHNYDHQLTQLLSHLSSSLAALHPSAFANPRHPELLDAVKKGLQGFVQEMERVYVNGYDGGEGIKRWITKDSGNDELTVDGRNGAKVFVSILELLYHDLHKLRGICIPSTAGFHKKDVCLKDTNNEDNKLGLWFQKHGFEVSKTSSSHDGELRIKPYVTSGGIHGFLVNSRGDKHVFKHNNPGQDTGPLRQLIVHLDRYWNVCHYRIHSKPKAPCNIYQMLHWVCGLWHHPMRDPLRLHVMKLFPKPEGKEMMTHDKIGSDYLTLTVHTDAKITARALDKKLESVCGNAHDILIAILGNGNAEGRYACEFRINPDGLSYPSDPSQCFDMLLDILRRLFLQFRYISNRCSVAAEHHGWRDCQYGREIPTTRSHCIRQPETQPADQSSSQPNRQANDQTTCQANCQATCQVNCQPTSPLMSLLNDCLPGHLPHILESVGCKAQCKTCSPGTSGKPCLTPFGFRAFTGSTKTGKYLGSVLDNFMKNKYLSVLFCLVPNPPKTLPEHFGFALSLVGDWIQGAPMYSQTNEPTVQSSFESSIDKLSIQLCKSSELTNALMSAYGSQSVAHESCDDHHLINLTTSDICHGKRNDHVKVAPYVASLCCDSYYYVAYKSSAAYVSWAIYLPWTFWNLLNNLYNDFCNIYCADWGCRKCLRADKCRPGQHGLVDDKTDIPHCNCTSIVGCKAVSPLLYKYGLVFGNASELNTSNFKKTCSDFCSQLKKVLESKYFKNLFKECDNFLWKIREPFSYLVLALWLLSLLYLLHIMVIRLDLLYIKSHLHSPSSHRIAAQSLLAAGRVNKLGRVFYLQP